MRGHRQFLRSLLISGVLLFLTGITLAEGELKIDTAPLSLTELAAKADLVAVAQVKDTDYFYTRAFPSEGSAFLRILIAYKSSKPDEEIIEVYEQGLHPNECYFENPTVLEEGRRYLVFFRFDPDDSKIYRGLAEGCALEILVDENNRYALRYPIEGFQLTDKLDQLAVEYNFRDNYALVSEESLSPVKRDNLLAKGLIIPYQGKYKYTHGIDLTTARNLIALEALNTRKGRY